MEIKKIVVGDILTNCYVVGDENSCFVIDPGSNASEIEKAINGRKLVYIFLTHAHYDHICALLDLKETHPEAKIGMHSLEKERIGDADINLSGVFGSKVEYKKDIDVVFSDNMKIPFLDSEITVIHTPGHTDGSCALLLDNNLFTGDTLLLEGVGRTDLPGGNTENIIHSISKKLFLLPENTKVHPGHMGETTIGYEKANNPFMREFLNN